MAKQHKKKKVKSTYIINERALFTQAQQFVHKGQWYKARDIYIKILENNSKNDQALHELATLYYRSHEYPTALENLKKAAAINPHSLQHQIALGRVYCALQDWDKAILTNEAILEKNSENVLALYHLGFAFQGKKELERSVPLFEKAITLNPHFVEPYLELCSIFNKLKMDVRLAEHISLIENKIHEFNPLGQRVLYFALGRHFDQKSFYDKAFTYFEKANKMKLGNAVYNLESDVAFMKRIAQQINHEFLVNHSGCGLDDPSPIFIIGMPRSGTSLVEQILSCHPDVKAGGELSYFYGWASTFNFSAAHESCHSLAQRYLQAVSNIKRKAKHITDKLPDNYLFAGLIHLCFPEAKIIHCVRNPMDTCFSCYKQDFTGAHYYSYVF